MSDSRKFKRFKTLTLADVSFSRSRNIKKRVAIVNISRGGLAFESDMVFSSGDNVVLDLNSRFLTLAGTIRRVEQKIGAYLYGMEFSESSWFKKLMLSKFIAALTR